MLTVPQPAINISKFYIFAEVLVSSVYFLSFSLISMGVFKMTGLNGAKAFLPIWIWTFPLYCALTSDDYLGYSSIGRSCFSFASSLAIFNLTIKYVSNIICYNLRTYTNHIIDFSACKMLR